ncbi:Holliday junction resolvase RecU [Marinilactibacillus sp. XAAS-LB27]|uniref:Holliday junction resolvase RecU n=1 Tax=Marinilactibacillus sp. XAAS-LB27 TaxID=3114538 RepID=UPI002E18FFC0|nr:Holliday junction resolvase RecU [Marinilactibacillus sp. XAAS-LB27]
MRNQNRSHSALIAKRNGEHFEKLIEITCAYYSKMNIAHIQKTPEPMKILSVIDKTKGHFRAHFEKKAQPDFTGTLKDGKSIVFEAKHTEDPSIRFDRINMIQEQDLKLHDSLGAYSFILVSFKMRSFYAIPVEDWMHLKLTSGKKSVNQNEISEFEIAYGNGVLNIVGGIT